MPHGATPLRFKQDMEPISFTDEKRTGPVITVPIAEALEIATRKMGLKTPEHNRIEFVRKREKAVRKILRMHDSGNSAGTIRQTVGLTMIEVVEILNKHRPESFDQSGEGSIE